MAKALIRRGPKPKRYGIPPEAKRLEILFGLLNLKHFHGIWYNGLTISVRRFCGGMGGDGEPEYISWSEAAAILETAARIAAERKQAQAEFQFSARTGT